MSERLEDLLRTLESHEFAARVNLGSNLSTVRRIIRSDATTKALRKACEEDDKTLEQLLENVRRLTARSVDPRYESPWDAALTAHLILLSDLDSASAHLAAAMVQRAPRTWWAHREASEILTSAYRQSRTRNMPVISGTIADKYIPDLQETPTLLFRADAASEVVALSDVSFQHHDWPIRRTVIHVNSLVLFPAVQAEFSVHGSWRKVSSNCHSDTTTTRDAPPCEVRSV